MRRQNKNLNPRHLNLHRPRSQIYGPTGYIEKLGDRFISPTIAKAASLGCSGEKPQGILKFFSVLFSLFPQKAKLVNGLTTGRGGSGADESQQLYESQPSAT